MNNHQIQQSNIPLLTCAILAAVTTGGPAYAFGIYSVELKNTLGLSQPQLDTLSSAYFCAGLFSWIPGLLVDRYGVRRAMSCGGVAGATLMVLYWAVARQFVPLSSQTGVIWTLFWLGAGFCMANGLVIGSIYKILVCSSTTTTKGKSVGAAKGFVGLGSGVYACLFQAMKATLRTKSDLDFLPMAAIMSLLGAALPALMLLPQSREELTRLWSLPKEQIDQTTPRHFMVVYAGLAALAVMVMSTSLSELLGHETDNNEDDDGSHWELETLRHSSSSHISKGVLLLALWLGPILSLRVLPTASSNQKFMDDGSTVISSSTESYDAEELCQVVECPPQQQPVALQKNDNIQAGEQSPLLSKTLNNSQNNNDRHSYCTQKTESTILDLSGSSDDDTSTIVDHASSGDYNLTQMLLTPQAWVLVWIALVLVGSGTMMTNNMGVMVESLALAASQQEDVVTPACMAMFSVAQATSRVVTGAVSDAALARHGMPRPAFLIVASLIGALAHALLAMTDNHEQTLFLAGVALAGVAFGMIWPLMVLIIGDVFGTAHMATNYLFYDGCSSAFGTLLLSKFVTQQVYEAHIVVHHDSSNSSSSSAAETTTTCYGTECFRLSHWVVVALALSCVAAAIQLLRQTTNVYSNNNNNHKTTMIASSK